MHLII